MIFLSKPIFVTGHKSPDTDSICTSIAFATLRQLQGMNTIPIRAGEINKESMFALQYFKVEPQPLVTDVYRKVGDAVRCDVPALPKQASLKDAVQWFSQQGVDVAPVVEGNTFVGVVDKQVFADAFILSVLGKELPLIADLVHTPKQVFAPSDKGLDVPDTGEFVVVDGETYVGMINAADVELAEKQKVMLVDHNEQKQIIDGIEDAEIVSVVDHHRIGGTLMTDGPIFILFRPVGCTATIVTSLYEQEGVEIPKAIAGLLLSAILSDTVLFRSPTCTAEDKKTAIKLAAIAGVDVETYGMEMLKAGANVSDLTPDQIVHNDMKEFSDGIHTFTVAQVQVMDTTDVLKQKTELLAALERLRASKDFIASFLMVTSIIDEATTFLFAGDIEHVVAKAFAKDVADQAVYLPHVMSRKKQIIPPLLEAMK
ncbi:DHHA2 domain protein [Megasphaera hutchinsoni]|uniref:inorganic diphosphatase n=1 Tax=Megasphaera hutchinsoni TaxID=1588748 RepID=A0A134CIH4_9FIRM|nr:DHHA2 domain protein [Megasphaera hutchinsoni]